MARDCAAFDLNPTFRDGPSIGHFVRTRRPFVRQSRHFHRFAWTRARKDSTAAITTTDATDEFAGVFAALDLVENVAIEAGAPESFVDEIAERLGDGENVRRRRARELVDQLSDSCTRPMLSSGPGFLQQFVHRLDPVMGLGVRVLDPVVV